MTEFWPGLVLGIESSCDETSMALVKGRQIITNVVASQVDMHIKWGGVVPEAAARAHVENLIPTFREAMESAGEPLTAVAVTNRPGLVGALSVGLSAAKAIAWRHQVPLIGVHHIEGHLVSPLGDPQIELTYPHICLVVSGGHTELIEVHAPCKYTLLGETRDDAAGEAFDKGARLLGLGYPGGRAIQEAAKSGNPKRYALPQSLKNSPFEFSFSGLKTAMLRLVQKEGEGISVPDAAASLQHAIVESLTEKALTACQSRSVNALTVVGGVSANQALRDRLKSECSRRSIKIAIPPLDLCTDNAAMIALAGSIRLARGERSTWDLDCSPSADLP